jgi:hypothetical protein
VSIDLAAGVVIYEIPKFLGLHGKSSVAQTCLQVSLILASIAYC